MEDISDPAQLHLNPNIDRHITVYGYVRGTSFKPGVRLFCCSLCVALVRVLQTR
jgi:hypothetical protein